MLKLRQKLLELLGLNTRVCGGSHTRTQARTYLLIRDRLLLTVVTFRERALLQGAAQLFAVELVPVLYCSPVAFITFLCGDRVRRGYSLCDFFACGRLGLVSHLHSRLPPAMRHLAQASHCSH